MQQMRNASADERGFSMVELIMTIILLGVISAVAIPNFIDFRTDAKNGAAFGALGALRAAIAVTTVAIRLKEDPNNFTPKYPTVLEFQANRFNGSHPVMSGVTIMDSSAGIPKNPWTVSAYDVSVFNTVLDCGSLTKSLLFSDSGYTQRGWCYRVTSGEIWANTTNNGGSTGKKENSY